jgi:hypothetical protein
MFFTHFQKGIKGKNKSPHISCIQFVHTEVLSLPDELENMGLNIQGHMPLLLFKLSNFVV